MDLRPQPLPVDPSRVSGFSERLLTSHYQNDYGGALKRLKTIRQALATWEPAALANFKLNGLKREELIALNSWVPLSSCRARAGS